MRKEGKMTKKISLAFVTISMLLVFIAAPVKSESDTTPSSEKSHKWLKEIGFMTGYGTASLEKKSADYEVIPILPRFGFDINPLKGNIGGDLELIAEPIMNVVISPDANAEFGASCLLKYSAHITARIAPYIECGIGMVYTTQHTHEQGTQFNFLPQVGGGIQFFLNKNLALTGGYRYRHLSNAGISNDNSGINHHFLLVGLSYFFD
jgi:hypothetical protein